MTIPDAELMKYARYVIADFRKQGIESLLAGPDGTGRAEAPPGRIAQTLRLIDACMPSAEHLAARVATAIEPYADLDLAQDSLQSVYEEERAGLWRRTREALDEVIRKEADA